MNSSSKAKVYGICLKSGQNEYLLGLKARTGVNRDVIIQVLVDEMMKNSIFEKRIVHKAVKRQTQIQLLKKAKICSENGKMGEVSGTNHESSYGKRKTASKNNNNAN